MNPAVAHGTRWMRSQTKGHMIVKKVPHQTAIRLSADLWASITAVAGPRGVGEEIRRRLEEWQVLHDAGFRITTQTVRSIEKL